MIPSLTAFLNVGAPVLQAMVLGRIELADASRGSSRGLSRVSSVTGRWPARRRLGIPLTGGRLGSYVVILLSIVACDV